jgi:hypothetical protein
MIPVKCNYRLVVDNLIPHSPSSRLISLS